LAGDGSMKKLTLLGLLIFSLPGLSAAVDITEVYFNGFVSQGWINTTHNNYLVDNSRDGTAEFHEAAISIQNQVDERLRVGIQFLGRDFGESGNNAVLVDWAYGDYHWRDHLGLRIGKFKTPHGLYGQGRDIDILRPTVLLPQSVYNEDHRSFILGVQGLSLYGSVQMGHGGGFDYEVYAGAMNIPDPTQGFWHDLFIEVGQDQATLIQGMVDPDTTVNFLGVVDEDVYFEPVYGGSLSWISPCSRLRLGVSGMTTSFRMSGREQFSYSRAGSLAPEDDYFELLFDMKGDISHLYTISAEYRRDKLTLVSEYSREKVNEIAAEGYYLQGSLNAPSRWTWTYTFSRYLRNRDDYGGAEMVKMGLPDFVAWQNDYSLASRFDANDHVTLKAELHIIDGMGQLSKAKNRPGDPIAYKQWWSFATAKATIYF
jgi:hypothetical protein